MLPPPESTDVLGVDAVRWNLTDLYPDADSLRADLTAAEREAVSFADSYRGRVAGLEPSAFAQASDRLGALLDRLGRAYTYAYLHWVTATGDPARGALLQEVQERYSRAGQQVLFFDLEFAALDEPAVRALLDHPELASARHHLELVWLRREHLLSESEERILSEKAVTGRNAWNRLFDETLGAARFTLRDETLTEQAVLVKLHEPDRALRRDAALALTEGLDRLAHPLAFVFNTVLADKASDDRLRGYPHWLASRNLDNETTDEAVEALIEAVTSRYDLSARYYRLKARLLGLDGEMMDFDRYAPIAESERTYAWDEARFLVLDAYGAFHPTLADSAARFFDERWIDAPATEGKRGGAFSHGAVPSAHPYILMNFLGRARDVQTLAHELGHGVHQLLSREQGVFHADTPLTTAETASVFGEMLVFQRLLARETDPHNRLALLVHKIDDSMATVFRQVSMNRFEARIHAHRREHGELSPEQFGDLWIETQQPMFGDAVTLGEHYRRWWSYIPHFVHSPGYVYAYAFGELLVLALYARYRDGQEGFEEAYLDLLRAGGSDWPHELVGRLGIDLRDPGFWAQGLDAIEALVAEAEAVSTELADV